MVTMLGALGVVTVLSTATRDADTLEDDRGLFWRRPALAGVFTLMLLSLAGIPLTAGFIGKFYIIAAGVQSALWMLIILLVINIVISLFYYLRIIIAMSADLPSPVSVREPAQALSWEGPALLAALTVLLVWLGLYPHGLMPSFNTYPMG
jgi:NADH-quinone oxidoreductase subunit N